MPRVRFILGLAFAAFAGCSGYSTESLIDPHYKTVYVKTFDNQTFYPLNGLGWNSGGAPQTDGDCSVGGSQNFAFTSELRWARPTASSAGRSPPSRSRSSRRT